MPEKLTLQIALYQMNSIWQSPEQNLQLLKDHLHTLPSTTDLLVLPEMWATGFIMDPEKCALTIDSPVVKEVAHLAAQYQIDIVGSLPISKQGKYYNKAILHTADGIVHTYDKRYLFTLSGEDSSYQTGPCSGTFRYKGWHIQLQICYDLRFPESNTSTTPPDLIIYMANWPSARIYHWDQLLIARAIENQCYVAGCNRTGTDGNGWDFPGHSKVVDPTGQVVALTAADEVSTITTIGKKLLNTYRSKLPFYKDKKQL